MTLSTSEVAVCCSSDSDSSRVRCLLRFEQPHVLDRDHRLVGEGLDQLDLFFGEWAQPSTRVRREYTDRKVPPAAEERPAIARLPATRSTSRHFVLGVGLAHPEYELFVVQRRTRPTQLSRSRPD